MSHMPPKHPMGQPPNAARPGPAPQGMAAMPDRLETTSAETSQAENSSAFGQVLILFFKKLFSSSKS